MEVDLRISNSTICLIVEETCSAIYQALRRPYLQTPKTPNEWRSIAFEFHREYQVPFCLGAIDSKHVLIKKPPKSGSLYFNYKKNFSIVLMPMVDANYRVIYADFDLKTQ
uniref:DDE Tnp4 domain-containing protein n=1 Tax=Ditylenchus dipsaci TaxID=166011 RepID=A0A915E6P4_9BILA